MMASRNSNIDSTEKTVEMLINAKCDLDLQDKEGFTALMLATKYRHTNSSEKTVEMLTNAKQQ